MEENNNNNNQPTNMGETVNMNSNPNSNLNMNQNKQKGKFKALWIVLGIIIAIILGLQIYAMASGHGNVIQMIQDWTAPKSVAEDKIKVKVDENTENKIKENIDKIKEGANGVVQEVNKEVKEKAEVVGENVKEKTEEIRETVKEKIGEIKEKVEEGIGKVEEKIDEAKEKAEVRKLFLAKLKNDNEKNTEKLVEYRVDEVKVLSDEEKKGLVGNDYLITDTLAYVTYSVKPKDIKNTGWIAGNGEIEGDWIKNKTACVCVRNGKIEFSGTSW